MDRVWQAKYSNIQDPTLISFQWNSISIQRKFKFNSMKIQFQFNENSISIQRKLNFNSMKIQFQFNENSFNAQSILGGTA